MRNQFKLMLFFKNRSIGIRVKLVQNLLNIRSSLLFLFIPYLYMEFMWDILIELAELR